MNIEQTVSRLIAAIGHDGLLVEKYRRLLAEEFGHQRGWKITRPPKSNIALGELSRRGKRGCLLDESMNYLTGIDHSTWYRNLAGELVGVVTQPYGPINWNNLRLKISVPEYPKWYLPESKNLHFYLIEPVVTVSLTGTQITAYHDSRALWLQDRSNQLTIKKMKLAYVVAKAWDDEEFMDYLASDLVLDALK